MSPSFKAKMTLSWFLTILIKEPLSKLILFPMRFRPRLKTKKYRVVSKIYQMQLLTLDTLELMCRLRSLARASWLSVVSTVGTNQSRGDRRSMIVGARQTMKTTSYYLRVVEVDDCLHKTLRKASFCRIGLVARTQGRLRGKNSRLAQEMIN